MTCKICHDRGWLAYDVPPGDERFGKLAACTCTEAGRLAAQRAALSRGKLAGMDFATFKPLTALERQALRSAKSVAKGWAAGEAGSIVLYAPLQEAMQVFPGNPKALHITGAGCGKTHLAVSLAKAALATGRTVRLATESDLIERIRATYWDGATESQDGILAGLADAWLLALDDVGTAHVKPESLGWYQDILFQIINGRYTAGRPLVVTTNLTPTQLGEWVGARVRSRLSEMAEMCRLDGPDRREMVR